MFTERNDSKMDDRRQQIDLILPEPPKLDIRIHRNRTLVNTGWTPLHHTSDYYNSTGVKNEELTKASFVNEGTDGIRHLSTLEKNGKTSCSDADEVQNYSHFNINSRTYAQSSPNKRTRSKETQTPILGFEIDLLIDQQQNNDENDGKSGCFADSGKNKNNLKEKKSKSSNNSNSSSSKYEKKSLMKKTKSTTKREDVLVKEERVAVQGTKIPAKNEKIPPKKTKVLNERVKTCKTEKENINTEKEKIEKTSPEKSKKPKSNSKDGKFSTLLKRKPAVVKHRPVIPEEEAITGLKDGGIKYR